MNKKNIVDSHCHIHFSPLIEDIDGVIERATQNGVSHFLCVCVELEEMGSIFELTKRFHQIYASVGVHPNVENIVEPSIDDLVSLSSGNKVIAIGETGLDYFRGGERSRQQKDRFLLHIQASSVTKKPLIIHTRSAAEDTMSMLEEHADHTVGGVMHCFVENWDVAKRALDLGFYISYSGVVTFKNAESIREVAVKIPSDRILVETDAPYLAPVPNRGKTNEPSLIRYTVQHLANIRGVDEEVFAEQTSDNFFRLFFR